jgi:hypothetical protein
MTPTDDPDNANPVSYRKTSFTGSLDGTHRDRTTAALADIITPHAE